jgi:DNA-binding PadR family transcriptional regulator
MKKGDHLGEFEQLVLSAVLLCGEDAYGTTIHGRVESIAHPRAVSIGAVYATLDRLEEKKFVSSRVGGPRPERGGRAKRFFKVEAGGSRALKHSLALATKISKQLRLARGLVRPKC